MSRFNSRLRSAVIALAATVLLSGTAHAVPPKIFYACYIPSSGVVYRIKEVDLKQTCSSAEHVMFSWTDGGVVGPQGPQGPAGPTGPQGAPGTPGWSQTVVVSTASADVPPNVTTNKQVDCPVGTTVVSGGHEMYGFPAAGPFPTIVSSHPNQNGWLLTLYNSEPGAVTAKINVLAVCVK